MKVDEIIKQITITFSQIRDELDIKLKSKNYHIVEEKYHPEAFGSRWVLWSNNKDAVRFIWDGKEGYFVLEMVDVLPISYRTIWSETITRSYDPKIHDSTYIHEITNQIINGLN